MGRKGNGRNDVGGKVEEREKMRGGRGRELGSIGGVKPSAVGTSWNLRG